MELRDTFAQWLPIKRDVVTEYIRQVVAELAECTQQPLVERACCSYEFKLGKPELNVSWLAREGGEYKVIVFSFISKLVEFDLFKIGVV